MAVGGIPQEAIWAEPDRTRSEAAPESTLE